MKTKRHILSKSTFMMGLQCYKRLWRYENRPDLRTETSASQKLIFDKGIEVGTITQELFRNGKDASPIYHFHFQDSVVEKTNLIALFIVNLCGQKVDYKFFFGILNCDIVEIMMKQLHIMCFKFLYMP